MHCINSSPDQVDCEKRKIPEVLRKVLLLSPLSPTRLPSQLVPWAVCLFRSYGATFSVPCCFFIHWQDGHCPEPARNTSLLLLNLRRRETMVWQGLFASSNHNEWFLLRESKCGSSDLISIFSVFNACSLKYLFCFPGLFLLCRFHTTALFIQGVFKSRCWATHLPYTVSFSSLTIWSGEHSEHFTG